MSKSKTFKCFLKYNGMHLMKTPKLEVIQNSLNEVGGFDTILSLSIPLDF